MIERERFALVEDGQVVVGVAGQPDHVGHRQQRAAGGQGFPAAGLQLFECGGDHDAGGQPVVLTEFSGDQGIARQREKRVVVALSGAAGVGGVGGGEFGEDGVEGGAGFGVQIAADRRHAVDVLAADGDAAAPSPVDVGEVAVGVEAVGECVRQLGQFVGAVLAGQVGQVGFGFVAGFDVDEVRQSVEEAADHRDMPESDDPVALRLGGGGQHRLQGLAVERPTLTQIGGFVNPARRLGSGDPQPVGQRPGQCAAQLGRVGLVAELVDHRMLDGGQ